MTLVLYRSENFFNSNVFIVSVDLLTPYRFNTHGGPEAFDSTITSQRAVRTYQVSPVEASQPYLLPGDLIACRFCFVMPTCLADYLRLCFGEIIIK